MTTPRSDADMARELLASIEGKRLVTRRFTRAEIQNAADVHTRTVYGHSRWIQNELVRAGFDLTRTITTDTDPLGAWIEYRQEQIIPPDTHPNARCTTSPGLPSIAPRTMPPEKRSGPMHESDGGIPAFMIVVVLAIAIFALAWYATQAWYGIETLFPAP